MKKCPYCAEEIQDEAIICKHCGRDLTREPPHVIEQKRSQLTQYLADLEKSLASWERYLEEQNQLAQQAGRQVTLAYVGLFVGIFLVPVFGIGLILVIAGILAAITQSGKRNEAEDNQSNARRNIEVTRQKIAETKKRLNSLVVNLEYK